MQLNFKSWLERPLSEVTITHPTGQRIKLVAVPETKSLFTTIRIADDDAGELMINLRPLGGEAVAGSGVGFKPQYLVIDYYKAETEIERQILQFIAKRYGPGLKWGDDKEFEDQIKQKLNVTDLPSSIKVNTNPILLVLNSNGGVEYLMRRLIRDLDTFLKPMIDKGLLDYYAVHGIEDRNVLSDRYSKETEEHGKTKDAVIKYFKYVADLVLSRKYPTTKKLVSKIIDSYYGDIQPSKEKVDLKNNQIFKQLMDSWEGVGRYAAEQIISFNEQNLETVEKFLAAADKNKVHSNISTGYQIVNLLDYDLFEKFRESTERTPLLTPNWLFDKDVVKSLKEAGLEKRIEIIKEIIRKKIIDVFTHNGDMHDLPWDLIYKNYKNLDLPKEIEKGIEEIINKEEADKKKAKKEAEENSINSSYHLDWQDYKYLIVGDKSWKPVDYNLLVSLSNDKHDVDYGELALQTVVNREDVFYDAYEKAEQDAQEDVEERKSVNYGQDRQDVEDDIDYYYDDFIDSERLEDDIPPEDDDAWVDLIKNKYYDDFVKWRKKELEEEEEQESWRYEPDTDSNDFQIKLSQYEKEIAEEIGWEKGLVVLEKNDEKSTTILVHSKHVDKIKPLVKKLAEINLREKDEYDESLISYHHQITIYMPDKNERIKKSAYDWASGK